MTMKQVGGGENSEMDSRALAKSCNAVIAINDDRNPDLLFVVRGAIEICFTPRPGQADTADIVRIYRANEYIDYITKNSDNNGELKEYTINSIETVGGQCRFAQIPYQSYKKFANCPIRQADRMLPQMLDVLPHTIGVSRHKKWDILNSFEEADYASASNGGGIVLEKESSRAKYIYWILSGEIHIYKKLDGLYCVDGEKDSEHRKLVSASLEMVTDPKAAGKQELGARIGTLTGGSTLAAEDAGLLEKELSYSLVSGENLLVWRYPTSDALGAWPPETREALNDASLDKYNYIYENARCLQSKLILSRSNQIKIEKSLQMDHRTKKNYPLGNQRTLTALKQADLAIAKNNESVYLAHANRRSHVRYQREARREARCTDVHKSQFLFAKPLTGYVDDETEERLQRVKDLCITGYRENCFFRSEKLDVLRERERKA